MLREKAPSCVTSQKRMAVEKLLRTAYVLKGQNCGPSERVWSKIQCDSRRTLAVSKQQKGTNMEVVVFRNKQ